MYKVNVGSLKKNIYSSNTFCCCLGMLPRADMKMSGRTRPSENVVGTDKTLWECYDGWHPLRILLGQMRPAENVVGTYRTHWKYAFDGSATLKMWFGRIRPANNVVETHQGHWKCYWDVSEPQKMWSRRTEHVKNVKTAQASWNVVGIYHTHWKCCWDVSDPLRPNFQQCATLAFIAWIQASNKEGIITDRPTIFPPSDAQVVRFPRRRNSSSVCGPTGPARFPSAAAAWCSTYFEIHSLACKLEICVPVSREVPRQPTALFRSRQFVCRVFISKARAVRYRDRFVDFRATNVVLSFPNSVDKQTNIDILHARFSYSVSSGSEIKPRIKYEVAAVCCLTRTFAPFRGQ
jgi:hypothetical protein